MQWSMGLVVCLYGTGIIEVYGTCFVYLAFVLYLHNCSVYSEPIAALITVWMASVRWLEVTDALENQERSAYHPDFF